MFNKKYLYIKVIEAQEVGVDGSDDVFVEPFVTAKLNGHEHLHKKSTKVASGTQWWEHTFRFRIKDPLTDWVSIEVREKGLHMMTSDWIGEVQLRVRDFKDNNVHENWYKLGKGSWKSHTRAPRGYIHLVVHLMNNKQERPFGDETYGKMTLAEWESNGSSTHGSRTLEESDSSSNLSEELDPDKRNISFELLYPNIASAEYSISKNAWKILMEEHPSHSEILEMKKLNRVNCLHKGNFDTCTGNRYMVAVDGSKASSHAFDCTLKLLDPSKDHLFIVTVRERAIPNDFCDETSRIILTHKLWRAAAGIISQFQDKLKDTGIDYTTIMPVAEDAREMVCALVRKFKVNILVIGKHKEASEKMGSRYFRSFQRYCQAKAKCSVMTF